MCYDGGLGGCQCCEDGLESREKNNNLSIYDVREEMVSIPMQAFNGLSLQPVTPYLTFDPQKPVLLRSLPALTTCFAGGHARELLSATGRGGPEPPELESGDLDRGA